MGTTAALCRRLAPLATLLVAAALAEASVDVAAFAARTALSALDDAEALEKEVRVAERAEVSSGAKGALEVYPMLDDQLGRLFESALVAVRLAAAAASSAPASLALSAGELAEIAALDEHISGMLSVQLKEPLFFWHGPKWMVLTKLRKLADGVDASGTSLRARLQAAGAASVAPGQGAVAALRLLGPAQRELPPAAHPPIGPVPALGIAVGEAACGDMAAPGAASEVVPTCALGEVLADSSLALVGAVHLLILPSGQHALQRISGELRHMRSTVPPFVSLAPDPTIVAAGPPELEAFISTSLNNMARVSLDLLWLPYEAFKKQTWSYHKEMLQGLLAKGTIKGYGIQAGGLTKSLAQKLLDRTPKPSAWLTSHDLFRPVDPEAVAVARALGLSVVALPQVPGLPGAAGARLLEVAVGPDRLQQEVAQHRWSLQQGLSVALRLAPQGGSPSAELLKQLATGPALGAPEVRLLGGLHAAARPEKPLGPTEESGAAAPTGLEEAVHRGRLAAAKARREGGQAQAVAPQQPLGFVPGVRPSTLEDLEGQKKTYKANNHVIYKENFFDNATWDAIVAETKRLWKSRDIEANCNLDGVDRLGGYVVDITPRNSSLYRLIYGNEQLRRWVSEVNNEGEMWPSDFPIELREYGRDSKGMMCHPDLQMYAVAKKDLEFAVTVDNLSKCNVTFWDAAGVMHEIRTRANSLMMVRVEAARHCVSATEGGTRQILKFIWVGDYRKSNQFWMYTTNQCEQGNSNRQAVEKRRDPAYVDVHGAEL